MKTQFKVALFCAFLLVVYRVGYVQGQDRADRAAFENYQPSPTEEALIKAGVELRDGGGYVSALVLGQRYLEATGDVPATREVIRSAQVNKNTGAATIDLLSLTVAQNQKIIEQNAKILAQLEAKK